MKSTLYNILIFASIFNLSYLQPLVNANAIAVHRCDCSTYKSISDELSSTTRPTQGGNIFKEKSSKGIRYVPRKLNFKSIEKLVYNFLSEIFEQIEMVIYLSLYKLKVLYDFFRK